MHHKDVTEILKLFEKRITKLEKRVGELESEVEDMKKDTESKNISKAVDTHLAFPFDNISIKTTEYNQAESGRTVYSKSDLLGLQQLTESAAGGLPCYPKPAAPLNPELLEEGEIFEPWLQSSSMSSISPKSAPGNAKEHPESEGSVSSGKGNRGRQSGRTQSQSQQQHRKKLGDRPEFRERAKSESAVENITISTKSEDNTIATLSGKKEMRFGLMVQFPEDGDK